MYCWNQAYLIWSLEIVLKLSYLRCHLVILSSDFKQTTSKHFWCQLWINFLIGNIILSCLKNVMWTVWISVWMYAKRQGSKWINSAWKKLLQNLKSSSIFILDYFFLMELEGSVVWKKFCGMSGYLSKCMQNDRDVSRIFLYKNIHQKLHLQY